MRILQVCPYSWTSPGGVQRHAAGLSRALAGRNHQVRIAVPGRSSSNPDPATVPTEGHFTAAAGLPIIASDIDGYRCVVRHDVEAVLVTPGDGPALAAHAPQRYRQPVAVPRPRTAFDAD